MAGFDRDHLPWLRTALAAALFASIPAAYAASAADQRYQDERAACMQRPTTDRSACLREAAAARQAARTGALSGDAAYEANRTQRCNALPAADRDACIRRVRDQGTVSGSVESGGVLREYREVTLPPAPPAAPLVSPPPVTMPSPAVVPAPSPATSLAPPAVGVPAQPGPAAVSPHPAPAGVMLERPQ